tara:strand:+ start:5538 stop:5756 length:219 start_codon:yes stop_codon:yes gene_type:complete
MHEIMEEKIRSILKSMLFYYIENIGKPSKYTEDSALQLIINARMIKNVALRYKELGGKLPLDEYKKYWEDDE